MAKSPTKVKVAFEAHKSGGTGDTYYSATFTIPSIPKLLSNISDTKGFQHAGGEEVIHFNLTSVDAYSELLEQAQRALTPDYEFADPIQVLKQRARDAVERSRAA